MLTNDGAISLNKPIGGADRLPRIEPVGVLARTLAPIPPPGLVLLAIVSIQLGAAFAIQLFPALGATGTAFLRIALSAALLLLIARPKLDRTLRANVHWVLLYGGMLGGMNLCFYESIARIPLGIAVTIEFLGPLGVAIFTSRRLRDVLWALLALAGVAILTPEIGNDLDPVGILYAVVAGTCWGAFVLLSGRIGRTFEGSSGLAMGMTVAAFILLPFGFTSVETAVVEPWLLISIIAVALLSTAIPFTLEFEALKRMPPRTYGILITLEPAVAVSVGAILLGQPFDASTLLAMALVTIAALGVTIFDRNGPTAN